MAKKHFILGGSNSGKSSFAEQTALDIKKKFSGDLYYIATGLAYDKEMKKKIAKHKSERNPKFKTIDSPDLRTDILQNCTPNDIILVDCISISLSNILTIKEFSGRQIEDIESIIENCKSHLIIVGQETSMGIIPPNALSRRFLKVSGKFNQFLTRISNKVSLVVAGIPMLIKDE